MEFAKCAICGQEAHFLPPSHFKKHNIAYADYKEQYPDHPVTSASLRDKHAARNRLHNELRKGIARTDEERAKMSATKKSRYAAGDTVAWNKGIPRTEDEKHHLSVVAKEQYVNGRVHHMQGKHHTDATKSKIASHFIGRTLPEGVLEKREVTMQAKKAAGWIHPNATHITADTQALLSDPTWFATQHFTLQKSLTDIAHELSIDPSTSHRRFRALNIGSPQQFPVSKNEREIGTFLNTLGVQVVCNTRSVISPLELDIYLPEYKIAIEHCGLYWHSSMHKSPQYHKKKLAACTAAGIRLITMFEDEWQFSSDLVKQKLSHILGKSTQTSIAARKCEIDQRVSNIDKRIFLDANHIQGDGPGSINIGLRYEGQLVAMMCFIQQQNTAVLNRFATSCVVPGGFQRLLKSFIVTYPQFSNITSFADLRWSEGSVYANSGFKLIDTIPPDYYWVKGLLREHKFNFRHSRLKHRFDNYDPTKTEVQNCNANGWLQLYDCGKQKWTLALG